MNEHLTMNELLISLKHCKGMIGPDSCSGCPNAVPGSMDMDGFCECRFDNYEEMIHLLENLINNQQ